jgi:very-short-patch-repair endonuclease
MTAKPTSMRKHIAGARELRQTATEAERIAWHLLRELRLRGLKFRRQHPVGPWFADFCCPQRGLVVELDGSAHARPSQMRRDAERDFAFEQSGYTVLRISNGMVLQDPEAFVRRVVEWAEALPNFSGASAVTWCDTLTPDPVPAGARGEHAIIRGTAAVRDDNEVKHDLTYYVPRPLWGRGWREAPSEGSLRY